MKAVLLCATSYPISAKKEYKTNDSSNCVSLYALYACIKYPPHLPRSATFLNNYNGKTILIVSFHW